MGNAYTALSTHDQHDIIAGSSGVRGSATFVELNPLRRPPVHNGTIRALCAVRPGMVISGASDNIITLNNLDSGESPMKWDGHKKEVTKVVYKNTNGKHLILSGSRDETIKLWSFTCSAGKQSFEGHRLAISGLVLYDDTRFVSGARDATIRQWDVDTGRAIRVAEHSRNLVTHIAHCPAHNFLVQSSEDKEIKLWDSRDLGLVHQFPKKHHIQTHCDVTPDGLYCLSTSNGYNGDGCEISFYDLRQRKLLRELRGHNETVHSAIFLPQQVDTVAWRRLVLSVSADRSVKVWNCDESGDAPMTCLWSEDLPASGDLHACVGFNDGNIVVSGSNSTLAHMRLIGKAGRPYLRTISMQTQPAASTSSHAIAYEAPHSSHDT